MILNPFQRMLGVPDSADAAALLGLSPDRAHDAVQIEAALRDRLTQVFEHPDGRTPEAETVRRALRAAADQLRRRARSGTPALRAGSPRGGGSESRATRPRREVPLFNLTAFDRLVLAVLVAHGGWNSASRARLVALAASYGISVQGLLRVMTGLGGYARAGGPRLGVREITGAAAATASAGGLGTPLGPPLLDRLTENLSNELRRAEEGDPWPTIKLSLLFAVITIVVAIVVMKLLMQGDHAPPSPPQPAPTVLQQPAPAQVSIPGAAPSSRPPTAASSNRMAAFTSPPTFTGNGMPAEAVRAADQSAAAPAELDAMARRLSVSTEPTDRLHREWDDQIKMIATGWPLIGSAARLEIDRKLNEALRSAADMPAVSDRMLQTLMPPSSLSEPLDIWRGAWQAGTLARLTDSTLLPPVVAHRARTQLEVALPQHGSELGGFEAAAAAWLASIVPQMVAAMEFDDRTYDFWELWIAAENAIGPTQKGERSDAAVMAAITQILLTNTDLSRPGASVNVLGRLLRTAFEGPTPSRAVRAGILAAMEDENVTARDLWVLTSILASGAAGDHAKKWFKPALVVPEEADPRHRWRIKDELLAAWPGAKAASDGALADEDEPHKMVDPALAERWAQALSKLNEQPIFGDDAALLRQLLAASRLVEAAHALWEQDAAAATIVDLAAQMVDDLKDPGAAARRAAATPAPVRKIGQAIGRDGEWAAAYQQASRNPTERLNWMQSLRDNAGTDLGQTDAEVFVHEAYRGATLELRELALSILAAQFTTGPVVALELLDQFHDASANETVSEAIAAVTGRVLPAASSAAWRNEARLALAQHALDLREQQTGEADALVEQLIDSYAQQAAFLRIRITAPAPAAPPARITDAAEALWLAWMEAAGRADSAATVPDTLAGLQRRQSTVLRFAQGSVQAVVARQVGVLDLVAYVTASDAPPSAGPGGDDQLRAAVVRQLHEAADRRATAAGALEQAVHAQRAIADMWRLRMRLDRQAVAPDSGGATLRGASARTVGSESRGTGASLDQWTQRLEALQPNEPLAYLELGEDIADSATVPAQRELAGHVFALAAVLAPDRLGSSACLALAQLESNVMQKRRLQALAWLLSPIGSPALRAGNNAGAESQAASPSSAAAALALAEAFSRYRKGQGNHALTALQKPGAMALLEQYGHHVPGGPARFIEDCKAYRGQSKPALSSGEILHMLRLEIALLASDDRPWSIELAISLPQGGAGGPPLIEVDPARLPEMLNVDPTRALYRNGRWVSAAN